RWRSLASSNDVAVPWLAAARRRYSMLPDSFESVLLLLLPPVAGVILAAAITVRIGQAITRSQSTFDIRHVAVGASCAGLAYILYLLLASDYREPTAAGMSSDLTMVFTGAPFWLAILASASGAAASFGVKRKRHRSRRSV